MRIDLFLVEKGYTHSRSSAKQLIVSSLVKVNGNIITKPSFDACDDDKIEILQTVSYVSRGAYKLEGAVKAFCLKIEGRLCIDVGASSGGFTDYLLKNGAKSVIAVDSGSNQLAESLRNDQRVFVCENYNARYLMREDFEFVPNLAVMDVSFISATYIIQALYDVLDDGADFICLIKPQFEVGKGRIGKGGIVKNEKDRLFAIDRVVGYALQVGFAYKGLIESPIKGGDGNIEYLAHFCKN